MKIKVLSLKEPQATLMLLGAKLIETRGWKPLDLKLPARIGIHASAGYPGWCREMAESQPFRSVLGGRDLRLTLGKILCTVGLVACHSTNNLTCNRDDVIPFPQEDWYPVLGSNEWYFGDYSPRRQMWLTRDVRALKVPVAAKGALGLWDFDLQETA